MSDSPNVRLVAGALITVWQYGRDVSQLVDLSSRETWLENADYLERNQPGVFEEFYKLAKLVAYPDIYLPEAP